MPAFEASLYESVFNQANQGGKLAKALADLLCEFRLAEAEGVRAVKPDKFKAALAAFDGRFAGTEQQVRVGR